ncbi:hypothetical protein H9654_05710 [Stenotrophomonas sp. Sa5BUN4]|uniref:Uncharacterized protein n=1 Tax=Stenotrophomonas lacuserhaii TaxID=2760084 RepID=A0A8X8FR53_9GAMM|nr:hypothetical protein [Stenotrophomonas pennii]MBD7953702.1 hypothetical protein [Stenotrophomonas pennii]
MVLASIRCVKQDAVHALGFVRASTLLPRRGVLFSPQDKVDATLIRRRLALRALLSIGCLFLLRTFDSFQILISPTSRMSAWRKSA